MESMVMDSNPQEADLLARSIDKPISGTSDPPPTQSVWQNTGGADIVKGRVPVEAIFIGEDKDDEHTVFKDVVDNLIGPETDEDQINIPFEECVNLWRPWRKAIIVKLLGKPITYNYLCKRLSELWKLQGRPEVTDLENGHYVVRFTREADYVVALEDGPWIIMGHYLAVMKWKPFFQPEKETITKTMAWIRVSGLSVEIFEESILKKIGNTIGKTIKIDPNTANTIRGCYARICVEIDLHKRLKPSVVINGRRFKVAYEGLNQICFECGKFGHNKDQCPDIVRETETPDNSAGASEVHNKTSKQQEPTIDNPYGLWMIVDRRRNWNTRRARGQQHTKAAPVYHEPMDGHPEAPHNSGESPRMASANKFDALNTEEEDVEMLEQSSDEVNRLRESVSEVQAHGTTPIVRGVQKQNVMVEHGVNKRRLSEPSCAPQASSGKVTKTGNGVKKSHPTQPPIVLKQSEKRAAIAVGKNKDRGALTEVPNGGQMRLSPSNIPKEAVRDKHPNDTTSIIGDHHKNHPPDIRSSGNSGNIMNSNFIGDNPLFSDVEDPKNPQKRNQFVS